MKISYGITCCNEDRELDNLFRFLDKRIDDEDEIVVVYDQNKVTDKVMYLLEHFTRPNFSYYPFNFQNNFLENKNYMNTKCTGDYIFQLDADELPNEDLLRLIKIIIENNPAELIMTPRINIVKGLTAEHLVKWCWTLDESGWVNFPDYQKRVYKNLPDIQWTGHRVHGMISGYKSIIQLPPERCYAIIHNKTIDKQEAQNNLYETL